MESLITKIQQEAATANYVERKKILDTLRNLQYSIEAPEDTMQRVLHLDLQYAVIRVALDLDLLGIIRESKAPSNLHDLAATLSVDSLLLDRLLRYLAALGVINEVGRDSYAPTKYAFNLAKPEIQAGVKFYFDYCNPAYQEMPRYLAQTGYKNPTSFTDGMFQRGNKTDLITFDFIHGDPSRSANFNLFMKAQRGSQAKCFGIYPFEEESKGWPAERPLLVDVGGGAGHQTAAFKEQFPNLPGRVILQDMPEPIEDAKAVVPRDVERMVHNFFKPQPIKGAKYYYLRMILHDHTDENSVKILQHLALVMGKESVILLDEMILPPEHVDEVAMQGDLDMMVVHSSMERSEEQWAKLVGAAGLKIDKVVIYAEGFNLGIVACVLK